MINEKKAIPKHIKITLLKTNDKEQILKAEKKINSF